jgi:phosphosulfolactate synthase
MDYSKRAFSFYRGYELTSKPRKVGMLVATDRSIPMAIQRAYLEDHADIVDMAKFADHGGLIARHTEEYFKKKIGLYREFGIEMFIGGIAFEIAALQNKTSEYFQKVKELGFLGAEISDDVIPPLTDEQRSSAIKLACEIGLEPFTEVGRKYPDKPIDVKETVKTIQSDLDLGVKKVAVEISEIANFVKEGPDRLLQIVEQVGMDKLIFEVGHTGVLNTEVLGWLFKTLGPEISVENVDLTQCTELAAVRLGMSRLAGYRLVS